MNLYNFIREFIRGIMRVPRKEVIMNEVIPMELLDLVVPHMNNKDEWHTIMNDLLPRYGIDSPLRVCAFLAQCAHESSQFNTLSENLNYSAPALLAVFGKYFNESSAYDYERNPERIANRVYANRMGNGDEESGDGWKYRGRGVIQLTGKNNYQRLSSAISIDLVENPYIVSEDERIALRSAIWFWDRNSLNTLADAMDFAQLTKRINGGYNGLEDRERYYHKALSYYEIPIP